MKRQDSQHSSSSRRQKPPENHHAENIGCMSGIFNFLCKYHTNRKFLTSGRKREKNEYYSPRKSVQQEHSSNLPRSPTLPAEFRCRDSPPPPLVARLMGLNEVPTPPMTPESGSEKRRQLLGALEKCDQDLKALKKFIEVVKSAEKVKSSHAVVDFDESVRKISERKKLVDDKGNNRSSEVMNEQSPVSVLDDCFTRSPLMSAEKATHENNNDAGGEVQHKQQLRKIPREEGLFNAFFVDKIKTQELYHKNAQENESIFPFPFGCSKAMAESVNEVCSDLASGEKRELGRIGLALQEFIYKDLIEEVVKDMGYPSMHSLPLDSCKRRLCF